MTGQRACGRPDLPAGPECLPDPGQRPERVRQRHDLAGASDAGTRHGRHDALGKEVGKPLAELAGHAGVAGQEGAQPDRDDRPGVGGVQPRRPARRPGQQQVALVRQLLRFGEAHAGERPHAGIHAVHRLAAAQHLARLRAAPLHLAEQPGPDPQLAAGRDLADQARIQVSCGGDRLCHLHNR